MEKNMLSKKTQKRRKYLVTHKFDTSTTDKEIGKESQDLPNGMQSRENILAVKNFDTCELFLTRILDFP